MTITRTCNGCGEGIPGAQAGALVVQRDHNPGIVMPPTLTALDRTDWCKRCAAPIIAVVAEGLSRRHNVQRRSMAERAQSVVVPMTKPNPLTRRR